MVVTGESGDVGFGIGTRRAFDNRHNKEIRRTVYVCSELEIN